MKNKILKLNVCILSITLISLLIIRATRFEKFILGIMVVGTIISLIILIKRYVKSIKSLKKNVNESKSLLKEINNNSICIKDYLLILKKFNN